LTGELALSVLGGCIFEMYCSAAKRRKSDKIQAPGVIRANCSFFMEEVVYDDR
jgi:hypothetical protein